MNSTLPLSVSGRGSGGGVNHMRRPERESSLSVHVPDDHGATDLLHIDADSVAVRPRRHPGDTYPSLWFWFCVRSPVAVPRAQIEARAVEYWNAIASYFRK
jgi:hypothetical protein